MRKIKNNSFIDYRDFLQYFFPKQITGETDFSFFCIRYFTFQVYYTITGFK